MQFLINQLLAKRHLLALLTVFLGGAVTWGMLNTSIDSTFNAILSEDDPYREEVEQVRKDFPPSTSVLFAFLSTSGDVFNLDMLHAMEDLTNRYIEVESAIAVGSLLNRRLNAVDADQFNRNYLIPDLSTLTQDDLNSIRQIALNDEDLTKSMLSPEGDMALAVIKYKATADDQATRLRIAESVVALRDSLREDYPEITLYVLGGVLFELDGYNAQIKDTRYLFPFVITISILLLWFCLKSLPFSLCLFTVSFATIGLTVGTVGWAQVPFNQISTLGPLVVLVIAMADGIHIVSIYVQGLHKSLSKVEAMRQSLV
ncbi:MAG: MMPL family transporter, partial [Gammaproteobacteria bacterium]|nr:MMPL family transporter [Gammaproteobacteria bacterium]